MSKFKQWLKKAWDEAWETLDERMKKMTIEERREQLKSLRKQDG